MAAPFREAEFDIMYGEGISLEGDMIDIGVEKGIVEKSGAWLSYHGDRIGQGRENAKQFLRDNADVARQLETELRKELGLVRDAAAPPPAESTVASGANGKPAAPPPAARPSAAVPITRRS